MASNPMAEEAVKFEDVPPTGAIAAEILRNVRLNKYGRIIWGGKTNEDAAFKHYNGHHKVPLRPACWPCHNDVFNWLMEQAFTFLMAHSPIQVSLEERPIKVIIPEGDGLNR